MLLLPREVLLFDTALGAPASSIVLPTHLAPFSSLLGVYGRGVCQGGGDDGGVDLLYTLHTGTLVWRPPSYGVYSLHWIQGTCWQLLGVHVRSTYCC